MLIRAMVGQQITVAAARTALSALTRELGEDVDGFDGATQLFPTMAAIAEHGPEVLRGPGGADPRRSPAPPRRSPTAP